MPFFSGLFQEIYIIIDKALESMGIRWGLLTPETSKATGVADYEKPSCIE